MYNEVSRSAIERRKKKTNDALLHQNGTKEPNSDLLVVALERIPTEASRGIRFKPCPDGTFLICQVVKGGAAHRSGQVQVGDIIHDINGVDVRGVSTEDVIRLTKGPTGTTAIIALERMIGKPAHSSHQSPSSVSPIFNGQGRIGDTSGGLYSTLTPDGSGVSHFPVVALSGGPSLLSSPQGTFIDDATAHGSSEVTDSAGEDDEWLEGGREGLRISHTTDLSTASGSRITSLARDSFEGPSYPEGAAVRNVTLLRSSSRVRAAGESHVGVGLVFGKADDECFHITRAVSGSPAAQAMTEAAILPGDRLVAVDGSPLKGLPMDDVIKMLRGLPHTSVHLTLHRREKGGVVVARPAGRTTSTARGVDDFPSESAWAQTGSNCASNRRVDSGLAAGLAAKNRSQSNGAKRESTHGYEVWVNAERVKRVGAEGERASGRLVCCLSLVEGQKNSEGGSKCDDAQAWAYRLPWTGPDDSKEVGGNVGVLSFGGSRRRGEAEPMSVTEAVRNSEKGASWDHEAILTQVYSHQRKGKEKGGAGGEDVSKRMLDGRPVMLLVTVHLVKGKDGSVCEGFGGLRVETGCDVDRWIQIDAPSTEQGKARRKSMGNTSVRVQIKYRRKQSEKEGSSRQGSREYSQAASGALEPAVYEDWKQTGSRVGEVSAEDDDGQEDTVQELKRQIVMLTTSLGGAVREVKSKGNAERECREQVAMLEAAVRQLRGELSNKEQQLLGMEGKASTGEEATDHLHKLLAQVRQLLLENSDLRMARDEAYDVIRSQEDAISTLKQDISGFKNLKSALDKLQRENEKLMMQRQAEEKSIVAASGYVLETEMEARRELEREREDARKRERRLQRELEAETEDKKGLLHKLSHAASQVMLMEGRVKEVSTEAAGLAEERTNASFLCESLAELSQEHGQEVARLRAALIAREEELARMRSESFELTQQLVLQQASGSMSSSLTRGFLQNFTSVSPNLNGSHVVNANAQAPALASLGWHSKGRYDPDSLVSISSLSGREPSPPSQRGAGSFQVLPSPGPNSEARAPPLSGASWAATAATRHTHAPGGDAHFAGTVPASVSRSPPSSPQLPVRQAIGHSSYDASVTGSGVDFDGQAHHDGIGGSAAPGALEGQLQPWRVSGSGNLQAGGPGHGMAEVVSLTQGHIIDERDRGLGRSRDAGLQGSFSGDGTAMAQSAHLSNELVTVPRAELPADRGNDSDHHVWRVQSQDQMVRASDRQNLGGVAGHEIHFGHGVVSGKATELQYAEKQSAEAKRELLRAIASAERAVKHSLGA